MSLCCVVWGCAGGRARGRRAAGERRETSGGQHAACSRQQEASSKKRAHDGRRGEGCSDPTDRHCSFLHGEAMLFHLTKKQLNR